MTDTSTKPAAHTPRRNPWMAVMAATLLVVLGATTFGIFANRHGYGVGTAYTPHATPTTTPVASHIPIDPKTGLPASGSIEDLHMDAPDDGWAVGSVFTDKIGNKRAYTLHYTGGRWQVVGPDYQGADLYKVFVTAPGDVWAGGARFTITTKPDSQGGTSGGSQTIGPLLIHYTGGAWHEVHVPIVNAIGGIWMFPDGTGWVIGSIDNSGPFLLRYQQGKWTNIFLGTLNNPTFDMFAQNEGWIADGNRLMHYQNGQLITTTLAANDFIDSIDMLASNDGWASGGKRTGRMANGYGGPTVPLMLHYDGTAWQPVQLPTLALPNTEPAIGVLAMTSSTFGWAVLDNEYGNETLLRYDGHQWTPVTAPTGVEIFAISATGPDDAWASGFTGGGGYFTAMPGGPSLLHYTNGAWHVYTQP